ncbi:MAG: hypothetical protein NZ551_08220 [Microscillaceae bacterium]|nr:hypothetical protein [Microscillaceae bacterium]MDW8461183.1 hypothetical protein [Cytophagales bacterium]
MEHKIYTKKEFKKPSLVQKFFGKKPKENALTEINNLLAEKDLRDITLEEIHLIASKYGVNPSVDFEQEILQFYKDYLKSCLEDRFVSEEELKDLKHLKYILEINDKEVAKIHEELAGEIYRKEVERVINDGELDENERIFIEKLQNDLRLPDSIAKKIYQTSGQELIRNFMNNAIADAKLTPEEEQELIKIAKNLNAEVRLDSATKSSLEKYKLYWQIENDEMPELVVDINIPRNEKCYFHTQAIWYEPVKEAQQIIHSSSSLRIKIAKGLYWRNKNEAVKKIDNNWEAIDTGDMYLTNKRILFKGKKGDKIILLNRILDFTVYSNGIDIERETGKNPFLSFERTTDIFAMLLGKAISQLKS